MQKEDKENIIVVCERGGDNLRISINETTTKDEVDAIAVALHEYAQRHFNQVEKPNDPVIH